MVAESRIDERRLGELLRDLARRRVGVRLLDAFLRVLDENDRRPLVRGVEAALDDLVAAFGARS